MIRKFIGLCFIVLILASGCATLPTPAVQESMGAVAIEVDLRLRGDLFSLFPGFVEPNAIFFARLDESGEVHNQNELYQSNYIIGDTVYLLNAKPGTYVAVGFRAQKKSENQNQIIKDAYVLFDVLVPEKMIELTKVKVCSGKVSYMGEFHMVEPEFSDRAKVVDKAQQHYYGKMIQATYGDVYGKDYFKDKTFDLKKRAATFSEINPTFGALLERHERSEVHIEKHLKSAHQSMKDTSWAPVFLNSLGDKKCR